MQFHLLGKQKSKLAHEAQRDKRRPRVNLVGITNHKAEEVC